MDEPTDLQLTLLPIGESTESHRDRCIREAMAAHTFARGVPVGELHAHVWGLDAGAIAAEHRRPRGRS